MCQIQWHVNFISFNSALGPPHGHASEGHNVMKIKILQLLLATIQQTYDAIEINGRDKITKWCLEALTRTWALWI